MTMDFENIKKLMGWCPYAKLSGSSGAHEWNLSLNFEASEKPNGGKAGNLNQSQSSSFFSRLSHRILLITAYITLLYFIQLVGNGMNSQAFFEGFALSLLLGAFFWKKEIHQYDNLKKRSGVASNYGKNGKKKFLLLFVTLVFITIILTIILFRIQNAQTFFSFFAGTLFFMWISYLQIIYWEKKNHMRIYKKNEGGLEVKYI